MREHQGSESRVQAVVSAEKSPAGSTGSRVEVRTSRTSFRAHPTHKRSLNFNTLSGFPVCKSTILMRARLNGMGRVSIMAKYLPLGERKRSSDGGPKRL